LWVETVRAGRHLCIGTEEATNQGQEREREKFRLSADKETFFLKEKKEKENRSTV